MLSSRSPRVLLGLAGLVAIAAFGFWWWTRESPPASTSPSKEVKQVSAEIQFSDEVRKLEPEQPVETALQGGQGDRYEVDLEAGQYVHLAADQRGIDVALRLRAPDGRQLAQVDSPNGDQGPEPLFEIPETSGRFRVEIFSEAPPARNGRYEIKLDALRPAGEDERKHVRAFRLFQEGEDLRRKQTTEASQQAVPKYEEALGLWRELADREWEAESLCRIGWVHQVLNENRAALAVFQEVLPLLQALGKRYEEGRTLLRCGMIELHNGRIQEAIELELRAHSILQGTGRLSLE